MNEGDYAEFHPPIGTLGAESTTTYLYNGEDNMPSQRLLDAFRRGEVTEGGLAEAGWFEVGTSGNGDRIFRRKEKETE